MHSIYFMLPVLIIQPTVAEACSKHDQARPGQNYAGAPEESYLNECFVSPASTALCFVGGDHIQTKSTFRADSCICWWEDAATGHLQGLACSCEVSTGMQQSIGPVKGKTERHSIKKSKDKTCLNTDWIVSCTVWELMCAFQCEQNVEELKTEKWEPWKHLLHSAQQDRSHLIRHLRACCMPPIHLLIFRRTCQPLLDRISANWNFGTWMLADNVWTLRLLTGPRQPRQALQII